MHSDTDNDKLFNGSYIRHARALKYFQDEKIYLCFENFSILKGYIFYF